MWRRWTVWVLKVDELVVSFLRGAILVLLQEMISRRGINVLAVALVLLAVLLVW